MKPDLFPVLPVACPLVVAALIAGLHKWLSRVVIDLITLAATAVNLLFCLQMLHLSWSHSILYWFGNWFPRGRMALGIGFLVDPMGAAFAALASFLTLMGIVYSWRTMESGQNYFQPLILIFLAAMCGFVLTADLFNLFVFFELMSTAAFALCGLKVLEPSPLQGAFNFALTNTVGAFFILTGIAFLYGATGALNMGQIGWLLGARNDTLVTTACLFIVSGFFIKAAICPFHFWLPDAHSVAPTPVCVLFSGIMVELGLLGVLRVLVTVFGSSFHPGSSPLKIGLAALGTITAVWGGIMCFAEHHLKRILAFSTIAHSGLMLLAMSTGSAVAIAGWVLYVFGHALIKSSLFFVSGTLLHRFRTLSEPALFRHGRTVKLAGALWLIGGLGLAALPPFATSIAEDLIVRSAGGIQTEVFHAAFLVAGILTGGAVLRVFIRVFLGWGDRGPHDRSSKLDEAPEARDRKGYWRLVLPPAVCLVGAASIVLIPGLGTLALEAAQRFLSQNLYVGLIYGQSTSHATPPVLHTTFSTASSLTAILLAVLLALWAVFHLSIPRWLRWPSHLEGSMTWARRLQSGQPADYVVWSMLGMGFLGSILYALK